MGEEAACRVRSEQCEARMKMAKEQEECLAQKEEACRMRKEQHEARIKMAKELLRKEALENRAQFEEVRSKVCEDVQIRPKDVERKEQAAANTSDILRDAGEPRCSAAVSSTAAAAMSQWSIVEQEHWDGMSMKLLAQECKQ